MNNVDCNKCKYVNITGDDRMKGFVNTGHKQRQICLFHNRHLFPHKDILSPCLECMGADFKERLTYESV